MIMSTGYGLGGPEPRGPSVSAPRRHGSQHDPPDIDGHLGPGQYARDCQILGCPGGTRNAVGAPRRHLLSKVLTGVISSSGYLHSLVGSSAGRKRLG